MGRQQSVALSLAWSAALLINNLQSKMPHGVVNDSSSPADSEPPSARASLIT